MKVTGGIAYPRSKERDKTQFNYQKFFLNSCSVHISKSNPMLSVVIFFLIRMQAY